MLPARAQGYSRRALEYASAKDFCSIFRQDMDILYWLALALTGDAGKAEQCFVAGCVQGVGPFLEPTCCYQERDPAHLASVSRDQRRAGTPFARGVGIAGRDTCRTYEPAAV